MGHKDENAREMSKQKARAIVNKMQSQATLKIEEEGIVDIEQETALMRNNSTDGRTDIASFNKLDEAIAAEYVKAKLSDLNFFT